MFEDICDARLELLVQLWKLEATTAKTEATLEKINISKLKMGSFILFFRVSQVRVSLLYSLQLSVDRGERFCHFLYILWNIFYSRSASSSLRALVIVVFVSCDIGIVRHWATLFFTLEALLVFPIIFIKGCFTSTTSTSSSTNNYLRKDNPLDVVILGTTILIYLSKRWRVCGQDLGYWFFLVVKSFWRSTFSLI